MSTTNLLTVITEDEIKASIAKIASDYGKMYENEQLIIVAELSGVFVFLSDLIRELPIDTAIQFVTTPNQVQLEKRFKIDIGLSTSLKDQNVLIVTDVFYRGSSLSRLYELVQLEKPKDVKILSLVNKQCTNKNTNLPVSYLFNIEDCFLVGYGLTHNESYRGLKSIYKLVENPNQEDKK